MGNREEKIDQWIFQEGVKKDRRNKIIPSSTDSITNRPVGTALDAMEKVAFYFGDRPELPTVEFGLIKEEEIHLSFGREVDMEPPFWPVSDDVQDLWGITHDDALTLATGNTYGQQTAPLTAIGNSLAGAKLLLNTNRWQVMGSVGLARFSTALMVGQVMEQATEPWAKDHHIWLVGYRELGPKLVNFLVHYHDESRFHLVDSVEQITSEDIAGTSATLYVMGSTEASLKAYERLTGNVGMFTDTVLTERSMFISEDDDEAATILNATPDGMKIWPNLVGEGDALYEAMELTWQKRLDVEKEAQQAAEKLTIEDFLTAAPAAAPGATTEAAPMDPVESNISVKELEALVNGFPTDDEVTALEPDPEPLPVNERNLEVDTAVPAHEPSLHEDFESTLTLLGAPQLRGADGAVATGKPAEAVAYLHFNGLSQDSVELSQALWPEAENEGNTARTRRSRTAKKIKDTLSDSFRNDTQWEINPLDTDLERIINALNQDRDPQRSILACQAIESPLQGCAEWADEHRQRIVKQLLQALDDATGQALENDQFEIAKAARQASKKL